MPLDPSLLPNLRDIQRRARALAMIEAIVCPEWADRYYSYNRAWGRNEELASMRNGSGDDWFLLFGPFGAGIKGLAHECGLAGDAELLATARLTIPATFTSFLEEPAFSWERMSFCYWRSADDKTWNRVTHPEANRALLDDGSSEFLALLHQPATAYAEFAEWYYDVLLPQASVEAIFRCEPLTMELVESVNAEISLDAVTADAQQIGYPLVSDA